MITRGEITPPGRTDRGEGPRLRFYASGDLIWERNLMADLLRQRAEHPLGEIRQVWRDGDVVFAQLETCFGAGGASQRTGKRISYLTDPALIPHLAAGGFNLACLASNHTMDNGPAPIEFTKEALQGLGIAVSGSGSNLAEARRPACVDAAGFRLALLSYATSDEDSDATAVSPGNAPFIRELVIEDLAATDADFKLVSVHKGREFVDYPHPDHQEDCRAIIDAGADLVLGHHPHFMQGVEWRRRPDGRQAAIFYSLGSLLVDYEPALSRYEQSLFARSQRGNAIVRCDLDAGGVRALELFPVRQTEDWRVIQEAGDEARATINHIGEISKPLNQPGTCQKFWTTGWPYLAIQYPSLWMHIRRRPSYLGEAVRWLLKEETMRLQWGAIFGRDLPAALLALRRGCVSALRKAKRLLRGRK